MNKSETLNRLRWCLRSADLLNPEEVPDNITPVRVTAEQTSSSQLAAVADWCTAQQPVSRLGLLFEQAFAGYLHQLKSPRPSNQKRFHPVHTRLQVQATGSRQTAGEFDFIYQDVLTSETIHTELAVKFYLGDASDHRQLRQMDSWVGPNRMDRLDLKFRKLFFQQLLLSDTQDGRDALRRLNLPVDQLRRQYFVKGMLFLPWRCSFVEDKTTFLPPQINRHSSLGYWVSIREWRHMADRLPNPRWSILSRQQWIWYEYDALYHSTTPSADRCLTAGELQKKIEDMFSAVAKPVQVVAEFSHGVLQRYFVTPEDWSETT